MKRIAILGCTGSVGVNALRLIADRRDRFTVAALCANTSAEGLREQARAFTPTAVCLAGGELEAGDVPPGTARFSTAEGILACLEAAKPDLVLNAITGAAGLPASHWAVRSGVPLALANKESMVMAGSLLGELARETDTPILPVDSEHCAIFQCLHGEDRRAVRCIHLTGSGGPFRTRPLSTFAEITPEEALQHPNWDMGPRITIGSATMMNKAFEILEARWLFGLEPDRIKVVIHPQSIMHSMVEFVDGSMLGQLGVPDMRVPILYCLSYPERVPFDFAPFDPARFRSLTFEAVDPERFPSIPLAYEVLEAGGDSGAVLNAADEEMTKLFLDGKTAFTEITETVAKIVRNRTPRPMQQIEDVLAADRMGREAVFASLGEGLASDSRS